MYSQNINAGDATSGGCFTSAYFTFSPDSVGNGIKFYNNSSEFATSSWDFGDANFSNVTSPYYTYVGPGFYRVCLTVMDSAGFCQDQYCMDIKVGNDTNACYASFNFFPDASGNGVSFSNNSNGYTDAQWDFGDGVFDYTANPYHVYGASGYYWVCLTVSDSINGCMANFCENVQVGQDTTGATCYTYSDFTFIPDTGNMVHFNNSSQGFTESNWD
ncbi:MAG: hypothetical protein JKY33_04855, partial [Bacteroidia bacterium]|nr:hypothetical protein [Bacteroidia bacterium]